MFAFVVGLLMINSLESRKLRDVRLRTETQREREREREIKKSPQLT